MTYTHQLYRPPGFRIFGALAGVMRYQTAIQVVGDSAIEGIIRTSNQIYYPFASGHISDPTQMVAHGVFHVFIKLSSQQPSKAVGGHFLEQQAFVFSKGHEGDQDGFVMVITN
jgi:hypothetical protein